MGAAVKLLALSGLKDIMLRYFVTKDNKGKVTAITDRLQLLKIVNSPEAKATTFTWNLRNGTTMKGSVVNVLNNHYIMVEEKKFLRTKISLVNISDLVSVLLIL